MSIELHHRNSYTPSAPRKICGGHLSPPELCSSKVTPTLYPRIYFSLRAQKTILQSIERSLSHHSPFDNPYDIRAVQSLSDVLQSLFESDYGNLQQTSSNSLSQIRSCICPGVSPQCAKLALSMLSSFSAISRFLSLVMVHQNAICDEPSGHPPSVSSTTTPPAYDRDSKTIILRVQSSALCALKHPPRGKSQVVCRICDKEIPLFLIEAHSKNCVLAYESSKTVISTDDRMRKLQALARQTVLRRPWPGLESTAVNIVMPLLHACVLLDQAIAVDSSASSATAELDLICQALMPLSLSMLNPEAGELLRKMCLVMSEKMSAASKFSAAIDLAQRTSLSPAGSPGNAPQPTIADFEFIKRISSGAFARVYLARKKRTGDIYAIKVIPKTGLRQKNEVRRVLAERDILLNVNSPFMIKFFYSILGQHNLYLAMEYLPGGDLFSVLQNLGCLPEDSAKIYTAQIVSALEFLRSSRVIHRDLKPDNILVDSSGRLKLVDFGLSFFGMVDRSNPMLDGEFVGTPDYTSPEIVLAQPHTFTADYWALGTLLFEFLTGSPPFHGETPAETFGNILSGYYPADELTDFSSEVQDLVGKLLCPDPDARLGAGSIAEIKEHAWFSAIDWDGLLELTPPFVPQLSGVFDTSYFEERIALQAGDEADILEDIRIATEDVMTGERRGSLLSFIEDDDDDDDGDIEQTFQSMAVRRLQETTNENARQIRLSREWLQGDSDDDADVYLSAAESLTPTRKRSRRRLPRNSFSPKASSPSRLSPSIVVASPGLMDNL